MQVPKLVKPPLLRKARAPKLKPGQRLPARRPSPFLWRVARGRCLKGCLRNDQKGQVDASLERMFRIIRDVPVVFQGFVLNEALDKKRNRFRHLPGLIGWLCAFVCYQKMVLLQVPWFFETYKPKSKSYKSGYSVRYLISLRDNIQGFLASGIGMSVFEGILVGPPGALCEIVSPSNKRSYFLCRRDYDEGSKIAYYVDGLFYPNVCSGNSVDVLAREHAEAWLREIEELENNGTEDP